MKGVKKYLFLMAVVAALFGFVACSSDDDGASEVAVYASDEETLTFYDDGTFKVVEDGKKTVATGTYTGDVTKNTGDGNKVTATIKKMVMEKGGKLVNLKDYFKDEIKKQPGANLLNKDQLNAVIDVALKEFTDIPVTIKGDILVIDEFGIYTKKK